MPAFKKDKPPFCSLTFSMVLVLVLVLLLGLFLRIYRLDALPAEIFMDIAVNYEDIQSILAGDFRIFFPANTGREGLFFYLCALVARLFGLSYLTIKITAALVGFFTLLAIFYLGYQIGGGWLGIVSAFFMATSSWHLVFSRLGWRTVTTPFFTALLVAFLLKFFREKNPSALFLAGGCLGLGMYSYTAFRFALPVFLVAFLLCFLFKSDKKIKNWRLWAASFFIFLIIYAPLLIYVFKNPHDYWFHSLRMLRPAGLEELKKIPLTFIKSIFQQSLMLHVRGDVVFRSNPTLQPQLDFISGLLFFVGFLPLFHLPRKTVILILSALLIFQLPSVLVFNYPREVPSACRSLGVIPFINLLTALGFCWLVSRVSRIKKIGSWSAAFLAIFLIICVFSINFQRYFVDYREGLPNHNFAFDRAIAREIDSLPSDTLVFVYSCCWGEWSQPWPTSIAYALKKPRPVYFLNETNLGVFTQSCFSDEQPCFAVWNPGERQLLLSLLPSDPGKLFFRFTPSGEALFVGWRNF